MATVTRSRNDIYLIGSTKEALCGTKLPSIGDVLGLYLHRLKTAKTKHEAATSTLEAVQIFWEKARIPMRRVDHAVKQVEELVQKWEGLKKNRARRTATQLANEEALKASFNDLFDIAHQDALVIIKIEEDKAFLLAQREKGRRGAMIGVDLSLVKKEQAQANKREKQLVWKKKQHAEMIDLDRVIVLESSTSSSSSEDTTDSEVEGAVGKVTPSAPKRGRTNILTPSVLSSLDRTKISDRCAVQIIAPIVQASGQSIEEYSINRSSIRRYRQLHRAKLAAELKADFNPLKPMVLHWDGKLMEDLTGDLKVDRLPVIVSGSGIEQLLSVPKLSSGTGQAMADAMIEAVSNWGVKDQIKALSFDTTSSNTGRKNGACVLVEQLLEKKVLYLACRHHIHEILLEEAFSTTMGPSSGPEILLFKRFKVFWPNIVVADYKPGVEVSTIAAELSNVSSDVMVFVANQLELPQQRDDYRELLELTLMFLGGVPPRGVSFRKPGAIHRARFMARLIYALKIYLFRDVGFKLTNRETQNLGNFCVFGVGVYIKPWFISRLPTAAPTSDLSLLKQLVTIDSPAAKGALKKLCGQLWYLSEELVAFAFFNRDIDASEKRSMVERLSREAEEDPPKRISLDKFKILEKRLCDFVTKNTWKFFQILSLPVSFLEVDPETWLTNPDYLQAEDVVRELRVVNDTAERGVALMQEYNALLTKDEEQTQFALLVVKEHRKHYPDCKKATLVKGLASTSSCTI